MPPDLERLQVIRAWLAERHHETRTIGTYLQLLAEEVDAAIAAASPADEPKAYRLQRMRVPQGRATLHRDGCWITGGGVLSHDEALIALDDVNLKGVLEMCQACRPQESLRSSARSR